MKGKSARKENCFSQPAITNESRVSQTQGAKKTKVVNNANDDDVNKKDGRKKSDI